MYAEFNTKEECARKLDKNDPLSRFRSDFFISPNVIYVDGNSLGLLSKQSETAILRVINEWKTLAIRGWLEAEIPWFFLSEKLGEMIAPIVGAKAYEVVATGTTTINLHALVSSFYQPIKDRTKILADALNFPTDIYALESQIKLKGLDPKQELILAESKDGRFLEEQDIIKLMNKQVALIILPSVLYRSGQLLNIPELTREAHKYNIPIGFDCSHSVGVIPHKFDEWGVDFAFWCSYKYLNGGPGSSAFLYVNEKHFNKQPGLVGWFGNKKETQFNMSLNFEPAGSAGRWQISSPGIIGTAAVEGALKIILEAKIDAIREKSLKLTSYLIYLIEEILSVPPYNFVIGTPKNEARRGGHVALERELYAFEVCEALKVHGIISDFRPKNIIRIAPIALYNTFHDVWQIVQILKRIIDSEEYKNYSKKSK